MLILTFDTETNGLPDWQKPSDNINQPHITQLAAILCDSETMEIAGQFEVMVKPNGWVISDEVAELNGITTEKAMKLGVPEAEALSMFITLYAQCDLRVAHNTTFDNRIIRIALKRYMPNLIPNDVWKDKEGYFCTLMKARKIMGGKKGHTLAEAYQYFCNKELQNAHTALADTKACMEIYFEMQALEA